MTKIQHLYDIANEYYDKVMALDDSTVTMLAKHIAYYAAMIDACEDDPLDDPEEQAEFHGYLKGMFRDAVEEYQRIVNPLI